MRERKGTMVKSVEGNHGSFGTNILPAEQKLGISCRFDGIVGKSVVMEKVFTLIEQAALTDLPILLMGETGTGKELVARALHFNGSRKGKPLIVQNCGALTSTLYESELFGHKRGAFTEAIADRRGLFEEADGGTIFLDEIGEAPLDLQIRLLRVVEYGEIRPVGENQSRKVDVRVLAVTNQDLLGLVEAGRFRQDLYYRLNVFPIWLPPLRDRREDIPLLVEHFLVKYREQTGRICAISAEAMEAMIICPWRGNVRELESVIRRALIVASGQVIDYGDIGLFRRVNGDPQVQHPLVQYIKGLMQNRFSFKQELAEYEQLILRIALEQADGCLRQASRLLDIPLSTFANKLRKYDLRQGAPVEQ